MEGICSALWGHGCAGRTDTGEWPHVPGVSRGLFHMSGIAATRVQQPVTEGGFLWRQPGFAGPAGLDWQFDGNFCRKQRLVCSQKEFLVTCSIQPCGARGQRVPGAGVLWVLVRVCHRIHSVSPA